MNIDPELREFADPEPFDHDKHVVLAGVADLKDTEVRAVATNEEILRKLQDDLRKAGYRKAK